jgi:putative membrane protein
VLHVKSALGAPLGRRPRPEDDMRVVPLRFLGLSLVGCTLLGACKGKGADASADTGSSVVKPAAGDTFAAARTPSGGDTTTRAGAVPNSASGAVLSDANIAALLDEANAGDSALGAAAMAKLSSTDAKNFARLMMGEHHALHLEGLSVEAAQHITPQLPSPDPFKPAVESEQTALSSMAKGKGYDSTYIAHEIGIHQAVISWAGTITPQNVGLQDYVKKAGPVLQKHLEEARAVQKKKSRSKS